MMHKYFKGKRILPFCFLCFVFVGFTQTAEQTRAKNWLLLQQLLALQTQAPYYLTAADKKQITALQSALVCQNTSKVCAIPLVLPVTGLLLSGQRISNEKVGLHWETKAEYNNLGFVLERQSIYNPAMYDSLAFIPGAGTSYSKSEYNYTDLNNFKGNSFYRVLQKDVDGHFSYSNTIMVGGYSGKFDLSVAPNPSFNGKVRFYFQGLDINQTVDIAIVNAIGVQILKKEKFLPTNGYFELTNQSLSQGHYFITASTNGAVATKQFSVVR